MKNVRDFGCEGVKKIILYVLASALAEVLFFFLSLILMPIIHNHIKVIERVISPFLMCLTFYVFVAFITKRDRSFLINDCIDYTGFKAKKYKGEVMVYYFSHLFYFLLYNAISMYIAYGKRYNILSTKVSSYIPMLMQNNGYIGFILSFIMFASVVSFIMLRPIKYMKK